MKISDSEIEKFLIDSQWNKVIDALKDIVKTDDASFHDYAAYIDAVANLQNKNLYPDAFDCFVKANSSKNSNRIILQGLYMRIENIIKTLGLKYFDDKNSHNVKRDFYLRARFMIFISASRNNDAINAISQLIEEYPYPSYYFQRSKVYVIQKQYKLAMDDLNKAIELSPSDSMLYYHRAILKQRLRDISGAFFDYDSAINYNQNNYSYYLSRGLLHEESGRYKNALDDFKKSIQLNPKNVKAFQEFAWCKYKLHRYNEALSFANIAMQLNDNDASTYYIKGCINNVLKNYQDACVDLDTAIRKDNGSNKEWASKLFHQKAWAEFSLQNYSQSQEDITQAIKLSPKNIQYQLFLLDLEFFINKNYFNAKGICQEILKLDPDNKRAKMALEEISKNI